MFVFAFVSRLTLLNSAGLSGCISLIIVVLLIYLDPETVGEYFARSEFSTFQVMKRVGCVIVFC